MTRIVLDHVHRHYRTGSDVVKALDGVSLSVQAGCFCAVSGPSGSGKSTLLNLMGLIDKPDEGRILFEGTEVQDLPEVELVRFRAQHVGFVFQSYHLIPVLTAVENVAWPLFFQGVKARERLARAYDALAQVGLSEQARRLPRRLSGGQHQRVAIARALVTRPKLILADEPTANLDRATAALIMDLMAGLVTEGGATLIAATHDPLVIKRADRHLQVAQGLLVDMTDTQPESAQVRNA
jgi:putative ABC transport system ATP-binding protein